MKTGNLLWIVMKLLVSHFIDLCKAFDSIDHALFLVKLHVDGFDDVSIGWFTNYLSYRL